VIEVLTLHFHAAMWVATYLPFIIGAGFSVLLWFQLNRDVREFARPADLVVPSLP
jgi:hypothetical protein